MFIYSKSNLLVWFSCFLFITMQVNAHHIKCSEVHAAAYLDEPVELIELLKQGADQNCRDEFRQTPLITATKAASMSVVELLLGLDVSINSRDEIGETALTKARRKMIFFDVKGGENYYELYKKMIDLLIKSGAEE